MSIETKKFVLSEFWKKKLEEILFESGLRIDIFATKFRLIFTFILGLFIALSWKGGRPESEIITELIALALQFGVYTLTFFLLYRANRTKKYSPNLKYIASLVEITVLTFLLWFLTYTQQNITMVYTGAMTMIYFIYIALASLRNTKSVIIFAGVLSVVQYGAIMLYFFPQTVPLAKELAMLTEQLAPTMFLQGLKFNIVSMSTMGIGLKIFYISTTCFLIVYSIYNSNRTTKEQADLIFNTEKEAILEENMRLGMELDVARKIQAMVLPSMEEEKACIGLDVKGGMRPAVEVGGDYYDVYPFPSGTSYFAIGDVTDHGLASGVVMLMAQSCYRTSLLSPNMSLKDILIEMNTVLYGNIQERLKDFRNLTLSLMKYQDGKLSVSGQHENFLLIRKGSEGVEVMDTTDLGMNIGMIDEIEEFVHEIEISFAVGDIALFYTDGITEAQNTDKEFYGHDRLLKSFLTHREKTSEEILQSVFDDVYSFIGNMEVYDDITAMVIKRKE
jgi:serine phosphatase RsbU (regulator of sigma subunit)